MITIRMTIKITITITGTITGTITIKNNDYDRVITITKTILDLTWL